MVNPHNLKYLRISLFVFVKRMIFEFILATAMLDQTTSHCGNKLFFFKISGLRAVFMVRRWENTTLNPMPTE
jgi:hypothetical protein